MKLKIRCLLNGIKIKNNIIWICNIYLYICRRRKSREAS